MAVIRHVLSVLGKACYVRGYDTDAPDMFRARAVRVAGALAMRCGYAPCMLRSRAGNVACKLLIHSMHLETVEQKSPENRTCPYSPGYVNYENKICYQLGLFSHMPPVRPFGPNISARMGSR